MIISSVDIFDILQLSIDEIVSFLLLTRFREWTAAKMSHTELESCFFLLCFPE